MGPGRPWVRAAACGAVALLTACRRGPAPTAVRLVDLFRPELATGRAPLPPPPPPMQWRFDGPAGTDAAGAGWEAGPGIDGLEVAGGRLRGRTTSPLSIVHLSRRPPADGSDVLEEIQVTLRASAGANLAIALSGQDEVDFSRVAVVNNPVVFPFAIPIIAG